MNKGLIKNEREYKCFFRFPEFGAGPVLHSIFSLGNKGENLETFEISSWHSERSDTACLSSPLHLFLANFPPKKTPAFHSPLLLQWGNDKQGESQGGTSQRSRLCTIKSSCIHSCLGAWMRHCVASTERPRNIIHVLNSSAGILPPDRSFIEIGSRRLSITSHDCCLISLAKWQECNHSN